jgi:hypothetical protein
LLLLLLLPCPNVYTTLIRGLRALQGPAELCWGQKGGGSTAYSRQQMRMLHLRSFSVSKNTCA